MIRIRLHGRGGHGVKTASRILGTAAFLAGYQTQDSPIYGAERRGAAVVAFARISRQPILERGVIGQPDLIVLGDETLLDDPTAGVLAGQQTARAMFVNIADANPLVAAHQIQAPVVSLDVTSLTLKKLASAAAISTGLAAAAARLVSVVSLAQLLEATRDELQQAGMRPEQIAANLEIAEEVFQRLPPLPDMETAAAERSERIEATRTGTTVAQLDNHLPILAAPSILAPGNSDARNTGGWRTERPVIDYDRCTRCGICFVRCPDGAIALNAEGYPIIDYDHCKGCMVCWNQCPVADAIERRKEVRAW